MRGGGAGGERGRVIVRAGMRVSVRVGAAFGVRLEVIGVYSSMGMGICK